MKSHRVLELYSGIGGMHSAWIDSNIKGDIVAAVDINTVANDVYKYNYPDTNVLNRNIQSLSSQDIQKMNVNTILMSPPCQPFTRNGKYLDSKDPRTDSFIYLINILNELTNIEYILMENVKGFECSAVRDLFINKLNECEYTYQEFLLCPSSIGIPNSRCRYYCIARRKQNTWTFNRRDDIMQSLSKEYREPYCLREILEPSVSDLFLLNDKQLKHGNILDICFGDSKRSCCFTKGYSHYIEGTGSVLTNANKNMVENCFERANCFNTGSDGFVEILKELRLRFFTPKELLLLMKFPKHFEFPETISMRQCYRLLGNSVNVKVISELLKVLFD